jgi:D-alanyl-D-alanine carboxypeptidase (penicillin-binding protein 5/6)
MVEGNKKKRKKRIKKTRNKIRKAQIGVFGAIVLFLLFYPGDNKYAYSQNLYQESSLIANPLPGFKVSQYPKKRDFYPPPIVSAKGVYIYDPDSGVVLFKKNPNKRLFPASTTKVMTAIVSLDNYSLGDVLEVRKLVNDGKDMGLFAGERMSVENLLYGALVHSANDAAFVLANNYPGGIDAFVDKMNKKAIEIGLKNTRFDNPAGYDSVNQYTTAHDLAILSNYVLQNQTLAHIVGTKSITVADESYSYFHYLRNVNELLGDIPGVAGVKTGSTPEAGENLVSLVKRGERKVIIAVLNSKDRFGETRNLIDWIFNEYKWTTFESKPGQ